MGDDVLQQLERRFLRGRSVEVDALHAELLGAWSRPGRHYHGPRHLLSVLDAVRSHAPADAFTLAAWFHDAVYDPTRADNEEESARWLERVASSLVAAGVRPEDVRLAAQLVRATSRPLDPPSAHPDAEAVARFLDADFQVFASLPEDYDRYVAAVREEYSFVPDDLFRAGRRAFLVKLQAAVDARGWFFREAPPQAESRARENLARELAGAS